MSFQVLQKGQKVSVKTCCNVGVVYIGQELVTLRKIWEECKTHVILGQFGLQKMATFGKVFDAPAYNCEHLTTRIQKDLFDGYICTKFLQSISSLFGPTLLLPLADLFGLLSISVPGG